VEREKEKYTHTERESFQLQATGSEHPGLASLASHAFSYDISKLVTQLSNWHEKLSKAPNSHDYIVNPDLTPCCCPWESFFASFIMVCHSVVIITFSKHSKYYISLFDKRLKRQRKWSNASHQVTFKNKNHCLAYLRF